MKEKQKKESKNKNDIFRMFEFREKITIQIYKQYLEVKFTEKNHFYKEEKKEIRNE